MSKCPICWQGIDSILEPVDTRTINGVLHVAPRRWIQERSELLGGIMAAPAHVPQAWIDWTDDCGRSTAPTIDVQQLATDFVRILREWLTADEWRAMVAKNATNTDPHVCASHDYCDANMAMAAAFAAQGVTVDVDSDEHTALWNAAWERAMPRLSGKE